MANNNAAKKKTDVETPDLNAVPDGRPQPGTASGGGLGDGFAPIVDSSADVARWLVKEDFAIGKLWRGVLVDAFLVPDKQNGGFNAAMAIKLTTIPADRKVAKVKDGKGTIEVEIEAGDTVCFSEKANLGFRTARLGDEVAFVATDTKEVGQPSPMIVFSKGVKSKPGNTAPTVLERCLADLKAKTAGAGDPWDAKAVAALMKSAEAAPGSDSKEIPF